MIRRGEWVPLLPLASRVITVGVLPLVLILTGADYLLPGAVPQSLTVVERAMPIGVWGALCVTAGVLMVAGLRWRWPWPAILGGHLGGAVFIAIAVGQGIAIANRPWWDGLRLPVLTLAIGVACWGCAWGWAAQIRGRA